ncbi:hypothetical protein [Variovorax sp. LT1R16]|uniref:hypothetical protein n=1 Tax=Variovorax sp. LT1R16 TaxID=3443728 RepID=UPI003F464439
MRIPSLGARLATVLVLACALSACGGSSDSGTPAPTTPTTPTTPPAPDTGVAPVKSCAP